jgi:hypothetical protein
MTDPSVAKAATRKQHISRESGIKLKLPTKSLNDDHQ